jgi:hypothetical protein
MGITSRLVQAAFIGLALIAPASSARAGDADAGVKAGTRLLGEGDRLADDGKYQDAESRYEDAFESILPSMRRLPFTSKVKRSVTKREDMKEMLINEFEADSTPEEFYANEMALKAFGFVKREVNLKELLIQVYSEEIAAFYDPKTKTMHLIKEDEARAKKQPSFLEQLFGKVAGFDKDERKTVIAHELTHALADQHFDIDAMQEKVKKNDDRALAVSALVEGEATLTMMGVGIDDWKGTQITQLRSEDLDRMFTFVTPFLSFLGGGNSLKTAPPIISESMLFPYVRGLVFCAKLVNSGGWKAVDDAYRNPPLSTEQVLHPDKYGDSPDLPMTVDLGGLTPGGDWKELGRNVLGEMQLAVLLRNSGGKSAAAGWDGDAYAVFEGPGHELALAWLTTWDSEHDAIEFSSGYLNYQTDKLEKGTPKPDPKALALTRERQGVAFALERRGKDVAVVEGFSPDVTAKLMDQIFKSTKTELKGPKP